MSPLGIGHLDLRRITAEAEVGRLAAVAGQCLEGDHVRGGNIITVCPAARRRPIHVLARLNQEPAMRIIPVTLVEVAGFAR